MYTTELKLNHNEVPAKIDMETGEIITISKRPNNIPEGKSKLDYNNFSIINNDMLRVLFDECNGNELKVILHMVYMSEFATNSLKPLGDELSYRELGKIFTIDDKTIKTILNRLKYLGYIFS